MVAGRLGVTLTVNGSEFLSQSVVLLNGAERPSTFVDSTQLQALVPPEDLKVAGTIEITVFTPGPGGGVSNIITFTVENPLPTLSALSPDAVPEDSPDFIVTVTGNGFVPGSVIRADGADRTTDFVSSTQLRTPVAAGEVLDPGTVNVTVFNPGPGGGESNPLAFTIEAAPNPTPSITMLTPGSAPAGRTGFTLSVTGTGFAFNSVVEWNGEARPTLPVSATELEAWISAEDVQVGGTIDVAVSTPGPGGGASNSVSFTVNNPAPSVAGLSPTAVVAGGGDFALTVTGTNFVPSSVVSRVEQ